MVADQVDAALRDAESSPNRRVEDGYQQQQQQPAKDTKSSRLPASHPRRYRYLPPGCRLRRTKRDVKTVMAAADGMREVLGLSMESRGAME